MKLSLIALLILLLSFSFAFGQDTTIVLTPTDDLYVQNGNFRNTDQLQLKFTKQRTILKFDLSQIEGTIKRARLEITSKERTFISDIDIVKGDKNDWTESNINSSNQPANAGTIGLIEGPAGGFQPNVTYSAALDFSTIDTEYLSLILYRASGRSQSGWSSINAFYPRESEEAAYRPKLILTVDDAIKDDDDGDDDNTDDDNDDDNNDDDSDGDNTSNIWSIEEDGTIYYNGGNVGIGTTTPLTKFVVDGEIRATKVRVRGDVNLPDYVFEPDYELRSLEEVAAYIDANGHLPEVPSAEQVEQEGLSLGDMDATLLKKIEELTLYMIEMKRENEALKQEVATLKQQLKQ
ncbi:MAG: DNRLRE domain-containing protein [Bacteroidota bacterium]